MDELRVVPDSIPGSTEGRTISALCICTAVIAATLVPWWIGFVMILRWIWR